MSDQPNEAAETVFRTLALANAEITSLRSALANAEKERDECRRDEVRISHSLTAQLDAALAKLADAEKVRDDAAWWKANYDKILDEARRNWEAERDALAGKLAETEEKLKEANYWRRNYADAVKLTEKERDDAHKSRMEHYEVLADVADVLGIPNGSDSPEEILEAVRRLRAERAVAFLAPPSDRGAEGRS